MSAPNENAPREDDPFACRSELRWALSRDDLALVGRTTLGEGERGLADEAAFLVAVALGRCRLFHVDPGELDGTLPLDIALAAARRAVELIEETVAEVDTLEVRWTGAACEFEREDIAASVPEFLMDCWAVQKSLDEALRTLGDEPGPDADELLATADRFEELFVALDRSARAEIGILSTVCDLPLFDNWHDALGDEFRSAMPWWLDGTLNRHAADAEAEIARSLPESAHWRSVAARGGIIATPQSPSRSPRRRKLAQPLSFALAFSRAEAPRRAEFWWHAPDGRQSAQLRIPAESRRTLTLVLFGRGDERPRFGVPAESITLVGIPAIALRDADSGTVADFDWEALEHAEESLAALQEPHGENGPDGEAGLNENSTAETAAPLGTPELIVGGVRWLPEPTTPEESTP